MTRKTTILILIISAIVLIFSGCAKKPVSDENINQNINIGRSPASSPLPLPKEIYTSNWNTYRNEKYGFEIKFPDELFYYNEIKKKENGNFEYLYNNQKNESVTFFEKKYINAGVGTANIHISINTYIGTIGDYYKQKFTDCYENKILEINKSQFMYLKCIGYADPVYYITKKNGFIYSFSANGNLKDDLDNMIQTIKFIK